MEAISWTVISTSQRNYQIINENLYFVNHLSAYEHFYRKKYSYKRSENITKIFSKYAVKYSCKFLEREEFSLENENKNENNTWKSLKSSEFERNERI